MEALNEQGKAMKNAKILLLGIAYKKDIDDDRESPSYKLIELLQKKGADVSYNDPHIPKLRPVRQYSYQMESTDLTPETLSGADCVLIATDHSAYDYDFILKHAKLIVDTRHVLVGRKGAENKVTMA